MRFLRGLSILGMLTSLALMVFQDSGLAEKMSPSSNKNPSGENTTNPKIGMVETLKTLQKLKKMRQEMENGLHTDCFDCPQKQLNKMEISKTAVAQRNPSQELETPPPLTNNNSSPSSEGHSLEMPSLKVTYQPPGLGSQTVELTGQKSFRQMELTKNSVILFEIPKDLTRCLYKNTKGVMMECSKSSDLSSLRMVETHDIGLHQFQFIHNKKVFEYRLQVLGIR